MSYVLKKNSDYVSSIEIIDEKFKLNLTDDIEKAFVYEDYMSASLIGELINCEVVRND